jgi:transposase-like protein
MKTQSRKTDKLGRKQYSKSERRELVQKYQNSGMSQSAFCKAYGLIGTTLSGWLHLMRKKQREQFPIEFAEVELPQREASALEAEVVCPGGKILRLRNLQASADHAAFIREVLSC